MKSESLWGGTFEITRAYHAIIKTARGRTGARNVTGNTNGSEGSNKKRKADDEEEDIDNDTTEEAYKSRVGSHHICTCNDYSGIGSSISKKKRRSRGKKRLEAELEGDKEDADRKLLEEFEEMEGLEQRVKRLREKREALRSKEKEVGATATTTVPIENPAPDATLEDEDEEDDDDEDDWDGFRLR
ncbi:hypothetical protein DID88_004536 [Monilinia fructigena]|uniref:Uncharacterized protein n=1 Tax=Monilinia fructigena TaxID=38457 RepID=A0A395ITH1_9HELO|nr:hypothetical protein DID88_004536 [Monilinia fructigena]